MFHHKSRPTKNRRLDDREVAQVPASIPFQRRNSPNNVLNNSNLLNVRDTFTSAHGNEP